MSIFQQNMDDEDDEKPKKAPEPAAAAQRDPVSNSKSGRGVAGKKRVKFNGGEDDDEVDLEEDAVMMEDIPSSKQGGVQTRRSQGPAVSEKSAKKMKLDEEKEVADLFTQSVRVAEQEIRIDMSVKKFAYRVASNI